MSHRPQIPNKIMITRKDLEDALDGRFEQYAKTTKLMIEPLAERVAEHDKILRGEDKRSGLIEDGNRLRWLAGSGFFAGIFSLLSWVKEWFK